MIPILYAANETAFTSNGIGRLRDCISCIVTEQRNGKYECEFEYPITGKWYHSIQEGMYISCIHDDTKTRQPFVIYKRTVPVDGIVKFYCRHVSYLLNNIIVEPYTATDASSAISGIPIHSINTNPFTFWTDKTTSANFDLDQPVSARGVLGGVRGSILDVYGGEYEFDHFTVKLYADRGVNTGATIRYGKNLADIEQDIDNGDVFDSIVPFWYQDGDLLMLDEKIVGTNQNKPVALDMSGYFQDKPTQAQLRAKANSYLTSNRPWVPKDNIKVNFVQLWQTDNYKDFAALQRVNLCDRVNVYYTLLGITAESVKVIKTVYNVLLERYDEMELGEAKSTFGQTLMKQTQEQIDALRQSMITTSVMQAAIDHATQLITGGLGGHVVYTLNADGEPEEILIMDTADVSTAVNVIRMNQNGIGFSTHGYAGPYTTAWTIDGRFNADFITTGALNASLITTGTLNANVIRAGIIADAQNKSYWNLATGVMKLVGELTIQKGNVSTLAKSVAYRTVYSYINGTVSVDSHTGNGLSVQYDSSGTTYGTIAIVPTNTGMHIIQQADPSLTSGTYTPERTIIERYGSTEYGMSEKLRNGLYTISVVDITAKKRIAAVQLAEDVLNIYLGRNQSVQTYVSISTSKIDININQGSSSDPRIYADNSQLTIVGGSKKLYGSSTNTYLHWDGQSLAYVSSSSKRYKQDITDKLDDAHDPNKLYELPVKQFKYKDGVKLQYPDMKDKTITGFIAEDVAEIYPSAAIYDDDGKIESWDERRVLPAMLKLIQDQKKEIEELKMRVDALEKKE